MLGVLRHKTYGRLFAAQVVALLGTGLLTIALGLTAFDLAGDQAGRVLGLALTVKMVAYVGLSPIAATLVAGLDRRRVLIGADIVRAATAFCLPFIDSAWQIYALIFLLQAASATFTPTFQAVIPDVLPDEREYTRALSLTRLAYDVENLISPVMAGLLLAILAPSGLFAGTGLGFIASAALVLSVRLPGTAPRAERPFLERLTGGARIYLSTPRLRGLLALNLTVAAIGSVVLVLSVVLARSIYGGTERDLAVLLGAYGAGSMAVALALPGLLERLRDRTVMVVAGGLATAAMILGGLFAALMGWPGWWAMLILWALIGAALAGVMTPSGRLLRRSAHSRDRPAIFAAQFALSHACWLLAYPMAGILGASMGVDATMMLMGAIGAVGLILARLLWPQETTAKEIEHTHDDLPPDHPHLHGAVKRGDVWVHRHVFVIDDEHRVWPTSG